MADKIIIGPVASHTEQDSRPGVSHTGARGTLPRTSAQTQPVGAAPQTPSIQSILLFGPELPKGVLDPIPFCEATQGDDGGILGPISHC